MARIPAISAPANGNKGFVKEMRRSIVIGKRTHSLTEYLEHQLQHLLLLIYSTLKLHKLLFVCFIERQTRALFKRNMAAAAAEEVPISDQYIIKYLVVPISLNKNVTPPTLMCGKSKFASDVVDSASL